MSKFYKDYFWRRGSPVGVGEIDAQGIAYKIVHDPYKRRVSVEQYRNGAFEKVVYDSHFLKFSKLRPEEHTAWEKVVVKQTNEETICHLRDQDDRLVLIEIHKTEQRICLMYSPHGLLLSRQHIFYQKLGDPFDGVVLLDSNGHTVLVKKYLVEEGGDLFEKCIEEEWDFERKPAFLEKIIEK
jgi:hypothetical protein